MLTLHKMLVKACKIWEDWKHFYKLVPTFSVVLTYLFFCLEQHAGYV